MCLDLEEACAGSVLFESEGLSGYFPPRKRRGKELPAALKSALERQAFARAQRGQQRHRHGEEESRRYAPESFPGCIEYNPSTAD